VSRFALRTRIALMAALSILLAVAVAGALVQVELSSQLRSQLDSTLRSRAADIAQISAATPALLTQPGVFDASLSDGGLVVEVFDRHGRIVARSLSLQGQTLPVAALAARVVRSGRPGYTGAQLDGQDMRVYAAPLSAIGGGPAAGGAVLVGGSTEQVDDTLRRVRELTILAGLLAAGLAAPVALLLTRRVLRPLARLARDAAEVRRTADPSRRLAGSDGGDEVAGLTRTLNGMLETLERARESERQFLADASHELRTPLTAARGNAAFLARHGHDPAAADLEADLARLSELVDGLLATAREDAAGPPTGPVRVDEVVRSLAGPDDLLVDTPEPATVLGDGEAIRRAILNLIENGRRYGPPGRPVRVTVAAGPENVVVTVADEGEGLPGVPLEQAVRRFWRGPNATGRPGSGLGLALVAATAQRHGGRLQVDGPRFAIVLPALKPFSESADTTDAASPGAETT